MKKLGLITIMGAALICYMSGGSVAYAEAKIGYVDIARVFDEYDKTKDNDRVLQQEGRKKEEERDALVHEIRQLKDELILLEGEAKESKQDTMESKVQELQQFDSEAKRDLGRQRSKVVREIFKDIDDVVQVYGEKQGFDLILNEKALIYSSSSLDVTEEVLKELNKKNKK